jgi:hypothetical protein
MYKPKAGEKWHVKGDKNKVLTVNYCNEYNRVGFSAPWRVRLLSTCQLETFHSKYVRVRGFYDAQIENEIERLKNK